MAEDPPTDEAKTELAREIDQHRLMLRDAIKEEWDMMMMYGDERDIISTQAAHAIDTLGDCIRVLGHEPTEIKTGIPRNNRDGRE